MSYQIELIRPVEVGDVIEHHTKHGTFTYKILLVDEDDVKPMGMSVDYVEDEE